MEGAPLRRKMKKQYIYTYDYQPQQTWLESGQEYDEEYRAKEAMAVAEYMKRDDVKAELQRTAATVQQLCGNKHCKTFALLSDTHYVLGGNWEYTYATIEAMQEKVAYDGVIHLGDYTDGILSKEICAEYTDRVLGRLRRMGRSVYAVIGNHDTNYFKQNQEYLSAEEQVKLYYVDTVNQKDDAKNATEEQHNLWQRRDVPDSALTFLILHSFDRDETNRYGFPLEEIDWVKGELNQLQPDRRVIILSHDAPLTELDYWAKEIRNGELLCDAVDEWNEANGNRVIAFLHGHTHADYIYDRRSFPIISVGCSKIEYFKDKKPDGSICAARNIGDVTQELWDTLIVNEDTWDIDLVRFGAGGDRRVICGQKLHRPEIWAHRGASGSAPENTMEAFRLAYEMGADGIELDVHYTKDQQLVVIHDETINRTSDGTGAVNSYTLEELRKFNYNKTHQEYERADIPTLEEVLEFLKPTDMKLNIELKTNINFYPGIETDVVAMVKKYDMADRVVYSSFNHVSVLRVKQIMPEAKCGFLYNVGITEVSDYAKSNGVECLHPWTMCVDYPYMMEKAKENGLDVNVWTVNTRQDILQMQQYGVNAIITNYPELAREIYDGVV